ncbi:LOW QUALITY PROTEIN: hypothetical protein QC762_408310 [Podospora pseudocomata]|uniref:Uncharacterized protein n=1 Tax=Podospora pseudocomata TaxID=2093779 RepID=A0ABR0GFZ9_9PEZI|nr:LOW QUALITY PROTEIN: hypothetical protein QC762_408310 [Podospora pseudocomata]
MAASHTKHTKHLSSQTWTNGCSNGVCWDTAVSLMPCGYYQSMYIPACYTSGRVALFRSEDNSSPEFGKTANERFATRQGRETQDKRKLQENVFKCEGVEHVNGVINNKFVVGGVELKVPILATGS